MLIQIHMLQNYAPSNLNRDDSGAPKDAIFGGYQRGRISSQAIKRSIRRSPIFEEAFAARGLLSQRTRLLPEEIKKELASLGADEQAQELVAKRVTEIGKREGKGNDKAAVDDPHLETQILVFLGSTEVQSVARKLWSLYQEKGPDVFADKKKLPVGEIEAAMQHEMPRSVDIAMFGRMTTSQAFEDVQAAIQVAHAISTNTVAPQFDYFTAVDDISGESGAGMIGTTEFNSNTYYKYFCIHWETLVENLGGDEAVAYETVQAFLQAAALANPSGKQNSFAAHNPPDYTLVEITPRNIPVSYANAFADPIAPSYTGSLMSNSIQALQAYVTRLRKSYKVASRIADMTLLDGINKMDGATRHETQVDLEEWTRAMIAEDVDG